MAYPTEQQRENKFHEGERVKIDESIPISYAGEEGKIVEILGDYRYVVAFSDGKEFHFHENDLKKILDDIYVNRSSEEEASSTDKQVGGDWYTKFSIQPIDFVLENGEHLHGNDAMTIKDVLKYLMRHREKGGEEDLEKAIHYIEMLKDHTY